MTDPAKPTIAVLGGTGNEGRGIALRLANAGYTVMIGSRHAGKAAETAAKINSILSRETTRGAENAAAVRAAAIVILAVPYVAELATIESVRKELRGKILVDVTAPLVPPKVSRVQLPEGGSAIAHVQQLLGADVRVVSAFQNVSAHRLTELEEAIDCDVLVCGDDAEARSRVIELIRAMGMRGFHAGPIANSAAAEAMTSVLIAINQWYKVPRGAGLRITGVDGLV